MAPRTLMTWLLAPLLLGACGLHDTGGTDVLLDQALEANARQRAGATPAPGAERTLTVETQAGLYTSTTGEDLARPPGFPEDIALPGDARILTATHLDGAWSLVLHSPRSVGLVFDDFRGAQHRGGWVVDAVREGAPVRVASFDKGRQHLEANFMAEPAGGTTLSLTVGPGPG